MSQTIEIKVPDIGNFKDVAVIEIAVKAGDQVEKEQALISLETDKATMDVPSPAAGVVKQLNIKVGDKVSEGSVILLLESSGAAAAAEKRVCMPIRRTRQSGYSVWNRCTSSQERMRLLPSASPCCV